MSGVFGLGSDYSDIFEMMSGGLGFSLWQIGFGHGECCAPLISFFTILAKGGQQAHKYNRFEQ